MKNNQKGRSRATTQASKKTISIYARGERPVSSVEVAAQSLSPFAHAANVFFFTYSPKTKALLSWSTNAKEVLGVRDADIIREGNLFLRHVHPRDRFLILSNLENSLDGIKPYEATYRWIRPDTNQLRWLHCRAHLSTVEKEKVFEGMIIDLSSLYSNDTTTSAVSNSDVLLTTLKQIAIVFDADGRVLFQNLTYKPGFSFGDPQFKFSEVTLGQTLINAFSDTKAQLEHTASLEEAHLKGYSQRTIQQQNKTFEVVYELIVDENDLPKIVMKANDISKEQQLSEELKKLSKTASYQVMTSGVVHNINNALQAVIGEASTLSHGNLDPNKVRIIADRIVKLAHRTADLTHELLDLNSDLLSEIDPNICVMTALNKVQEQTPSSMVLNVTFGNIELCLGRQRVLIETLSEILTTAWYTRTPISTSVHTYSNNSICAIEIKITYEDQQSPSNSFNFSDTLQNQNITINHSETTHALEVLLSLPVIRTDREKTEHKEKIPVGRIMIVDDDPLVGDTLRALLEQESVLALVFQLPQDAIDHLTNAPSSIDLIIVDALMPDITGEEFISEALKIAPGIPIVGLTGAPRMLESLLFSGAREVMLKPVNPSALKKLVFKYLDSNATTLPLAGNS